MRTGPVHRTVARDGRPYVCVHRSVACVAAGRPSLLFSYRALENFTYITIIVLESISVSWRITLHMSISRFYVTSTVCIGGTQPQNGPLFTTGEVLYYFISHLFYYNFHFYIF